MRRDRVPSLWKFWKLATSGPGYRVNQICLLSALEELPEISSAHGLIVDLGAGKGKGISNFASLLHLHAREKIIGIDLSAKDLKINPYLCSAVVGEVQTVPLRAEIANLVIAVDLVEHLPAPGLFFQEVKRLLVPGGCVLVTTPSLMGYKNLLAKLLPRATFDFFWMKFKGKTLDYPTFYRANTVKTLRRLCYETGLELIRIEYVTQVSHFLYPFPLLALLDYCYERLMCAIGLPMFQNYLVYLLRKP